jgi:uncharacterized protein (DUF58 family)
VTEHAASGRVQVGFGLAPTWLGVRAIAFYALIVASWIGAPYTNLFFLLLCFLTTIALQSLVATPRNVRGIGGELLEIEPVPAGTPAEVRVRLRAARPVWALAASVLVGGKRRRAAWSQRAASGEVLAGHLPPLPRGVHALHGARLESAWPFGFLRASRAIPAPAELIVHPEPAELPAARTKGELLALALGAPVAVAGDFGPSGLREYRMGDDPRRVDWKGTARRGALVVKEFDADARPGIEVCLDLRCEAGALEAALSLVTALAILARTDKEAFTLHAQGLSATFGPSHRPWRELLRWLAAAAPLPPGGAPPPAVSPSVPRLPLRGAR